MTGYKFVTCTNDGSEDCKECDVQQGPGLDHLQENCGGVWTKPRDLPAQLTRIVIVPVAVGTAAGAVISALSNAGVFDTLNDFLFSDAGLLIGGALAGAVITSLLFLYGLAWMLTSMFKR